MSHESDLPLSAVPIDANTAFTLPFGEHETLQISSQLFQAPQSEKATAQKLALEALDDAVDRTTIYLREIKEGRSSYDRKIETQISDLWRQASRAINDFDPLLANICYIKSQGWLDPKVWDTPEFKSMKLGLDDLRRSRMDFNARFNSSTPTAENTAIMANEKVSDLNAGSSSRNPVNDDGTTYDRWLKWLKNNRAVAGLLIFAIAVGGIASFTTAIATIKASLFPAAVIVPPPAPPKPRVWFSQTFSLGEGKAASTHGITINVLTIQLEEMHGTTAFVKVSTADDDFRPQVAKVESGSIISANQKGCDSEQVTITKVSLTWPEELTPGQLESLGPAGERLVKREVAGTISGRCDQ